MCKGVRCPPIFSLSKHVHAMHNSSASHEVNGVGSILVWSGGMDFEEI